MADPPGSVLRMEGDGDIQTVLAGLDSLTVYGETRTQRQAAYDLLLRLRCRMGSDGRWRQGLEVLLGEPEAQSMVIGEQMDRVDAAVGDVPTVWGGECAR